MWTKGDDEDGDDNDDDDEDDDDNANADDDNYVDYKGDDDDRRYKVLGVLFIYFESGDPPISLRHVNSLAMSNFSAYINNLKKFQHSPH